MKITAIFESWHIGDGNYSPLHVGELINLSFELDPTTIEVADDEVRYFEPLGQGEYRFCGKVLKVYLEDGNAEGREDLIIIEVTENFRFYLVVTDGKQYEGKIVQGLGTLLLDHYIWVEFLDEYLDAPDLFYTLKVAGIRKVQIPEKYIRRHATGKSLPSRLGSDEYKISETLETMEGQPFDEEFYIIDFDDSGLENVLVPRSFRG